MNTTEDAYVAEAMIRYGGSFVRALGQLWFMGDELNRTKLKVAFAEYWIKYQSLAARSLNQLTTPDPQ